jgi:hypothetical protein
MKTLHCLPVSLLLIAGCTPMPRPPAAPAPGPAAAEAPASAAQVLEWIKINQDTASPGQQLVADIIRGDSAQTFNNALAPWPSC